MLECGSLLNTRRQDVRTFVFLETTRYWCRNYKVLVHSETVLWDMNPVVEVFGLQTRMKSGKSASHCQNQLPASRCPVFKPTVKTHETIDGVMQQ